MKKNLWIVGIILFLLGAVMIFIGYNGAQLKDNPDHKANAIQIGLGLAAVMAGLVVFGANKPWGE